MVKLIEEQVLISKLFRKLARDYQCNIRYNSNYHPQANPTERVNRTIKSMLAIYVSDNHRLWDVNLSKIGYALRTAVHETTQQSPYFMNFGRRMKLSGEDYRTSLLNNEEEVNLDVRPAAFKALFTDVK